MLNVICAWAKYIAVLKGHSNFTFEGALPRSCAAALTGADAKVVMPEAGESVAKPSRTPYPPIYAASRSTEGKTLIAQHCDVWFGDYKPGYRNFEENIGRMASNFRSMEALARKYGRKLRYAINPQIFVPPRKRKPSGLRMKRSAAPDHAIAWSMRWSRPCRHPGGHRQAPAAL